MMKLSIIIPYHNEGEEFITETINSVRSSMMTKFYEIIVVDDCSDVPLKQIPMTNVKYLRHSTNKGVGAAFDTGVAIAKSDRLFLMGSDIRFKKDGWCKEIIRAIDKYPKALICGTCVGINKEKPENMNMDRKGATKRNGANILMFHDHKTHPKKPENFRNIIEAQWLPTKLEVESKDPYEIPCILGAAYGVNKEWYNYIDGFAGHKRWGTLEPYISLKSWFFGGQCLTAPRMRTGHIFKKVGTHNTSPYYLIYNKMFVATVLFSDFHANRLIDFLGHNPQVMKAKQELERNKEYILGKKEEYKQKIEVDPVTFCKRWDIDFRMNENKQIKIK